MHQFNEYAKYFFQKEKKRLLEAYPGVTLNRLQQEVRHYTLGDMMDDHDLYIPSESNPVTNFFKQVKTGVPLPYISGRSFFYKSEFIVNSDVLIPRFETEILVELAISEIATLPHPVRVIDVGTGSGAIIISLMQDSDRVIEGIGVDISQAALDVAKKNYFHLRYTIQRESTLEFLKCDRLEGVTQKQDLIVSNPPYIKATSDRNDVNAQVDNYEPSSALYLTDEEYDQWFLTFFEQSYFLLEDHGTLIMEGHEKHLEYLSTIAKGKGFKEISIVNDYTGRNRFMIARKSNG